jgi:hypothetical protein
MMLLMLLLHLRIGPFVANVVFGGDGGSNFYVVLVGCSNMRLSGLAPYEWRERNGRDTLKQGARKRK